MLLCNASAGKNYTIKAIDLPQTQLGLLKSRGIIPNTQITLLHCHRTGTVILRCRNGRHALGSYYTAHIRIERSL